MSEATTETTAPMTVVLPVENPTAHDPCDRCVGAALWKVILPSALELLFCGHHARKHGFASDGSHAAYSDENKTRGSDH